MGHTNDKNGSVEFESGETGIDDSAADETARLLGHSSEAITKEFYIEKDRTTPDVTHILQSFAGNATTTRSNE